MSRLAYYIPSILAALSLAGLCTASDKIKIQPTPKVGDAQKYKYELTFKVGDNDIDVTAEAEQSVVKVEKDLVSACLKWQNLKALVAGSDQATEYTDTKFDFKTNGELLKSDGGIHGADTIRNLLMVLFVPPTSEIGEGETYQTDFKEIANEAIPARKVMGTYVGKVDYKGSSVLKFTLKYTEIGDDAMTADTTFFVKENGSVVRAEVDFKKLPVPVIGQVVDGKAILEAE